MIDLSVPSPDDDAARVLIEHPQTTSELQIRASGPSQGMSGSAGLARRRQILIDAAETAVRAQGPSVSVAEITRVAGVGMSTFYRTFASREELLAELVSDRTQRIRTIWEHARDRVERGRRIVAVIELLLESEHQDPVMGAFFRQEILRQPELIIDVRQVASDVVADEIAAGALRADFGVDDITHLLMMLAALPPGDLATRRRMLDMALHGITTQRPSAQ